MIGPDRETWKVIALAAVTLLAIGFVCGFGAWWVVLWLTG